MPALAASNTNNAGGPAVREKPLPAERRRSELADFLRTRRAALQPEDVGLPSGGRRRTPGLRREEVAQLASVGATWYTWLEQGRDVRASLEVLEALARALRLTQAERTHLVLLGRGEEPPPYKSPAERVSPALRRLIDNLGPNPAFILGRRWDYLAWNDAAAALLGDLGSIPRPSRNHAWLTFESLITALRNTSPEFSRAWDRHEVSQAGEGRKDLRHPAVGMLSFSHAVFHPAEASEQRLILYSPLPDNDTPAKLATLLEGRAADVSDGAATSTSSRMLAPVLG
jgi:transcriptional regulator with XRE-family HTH domain